jgi:hypothetical protein
VVTTRTTFCYINNVRFPNTHHTLGLGKALWRHFDRTGSCLLAKTQPPEYNLSPSAQLVPVPHNHLISFSSQRFTLLPAYLYQMDERALPNNLQNSNDFRATSPLIVIMCNVSYCTSFLCFFPCSLWRTRWGQTVDQRPVFWEVTAEAENYYGIEHVILKSSRIWVPVRMKRLPWNSAWLWQLVKWRGSGHFSKRRATEYPEGVNLFVFVIDTGFLLCESQNVFLYTILKIDSHQRVCKWQRELIKQMNFQKPWE